MSKSGGNPVLHRTGFVPPPGPVPQRPMTYDDVVRKTLACLGLVLVGAVIGWLNPGLYLVGLIAGLALALVNIFRKAISPPLILAYAAFQGLALGAVSAMLNDLYPGVAVQAVIGSLAVFAAALALFSSGKVRATPKSTRFLLFAMLGLVLYGVLNLILSATGAVTTPWGLGGIEVLGVPLGAIIGVLAIGLAAFALITDFTDISNAISAGADEKQSWRAAFGLTLTLVWLYLEILRLLSILRGGD